MKTLLIAALAGATCAYVVPFLALLLFEWRGRHFNTSLEEYIYDLDGGWQRVRAFEDSQIVVTFILLFVLIAYLVLWLYMISQHKTRYKKGIFGNEASKSSEKGTGSLETNEFALATNTVTWNPNGRRPKYGGLAYGYSPLLHRYYLSRSEAHTYTEGPPGTGKTSECVVPTVHACIEARKSSTIIADPKEELVASTLHLAKKRAENVYWVNFSNPDSSDLFNPLTFIVDTFDEGMESWRQYVDLAAKARIAGNEDEEVFYARKADSHLKRALADADSYASDVAEALIPKPLTGQSESDFWKDAGQALLRALILLVCTYREIDWIDRHTKALTPPRREQKTLLSIQSLLGTYGKVSRVQEGKSSKDYVPLEDIFSCIERSHPAVMAFTAAKNAPNQALASTIMTLTVALSKFVNPACDAITYDSSFTFEQIASQKSVVYFTCSNERPALSVYLSVFVSQMYQAFARIAKKNGGQTPLKIQFIWEEAGNTPMMPVVPTMGGEARGFGLNMHLFVQGSSQIPLKYGDIGSKAIMDTINVRNYLKVVDVKQASDLSTRIGKATFDETQDTSSHTNFTLFEGSSSVRGTKSQDDYMHASSVLDWNPEWGHVVWRDKFGRKQGLLSKIFWRRDRINVAVYPIVKPEYLPTFTILGIVGRSRVATHSKTLALVDKTSSRIASIPWMGKALSDEEIMQLEKDLEAGAFRRETSNAIAEIVQENEEQSARNNYVMAHGNEQSLAEMHAAPYVSRIIEAYTGKTSYQNHVDKWIEHLKDLLRQELKQANNLTRTIESRFGCSKPFSCDDRLFQARRKATSEEFFKEVRRESLDLDPTEIIQSSKE